MFLFYRFLFNQRMPTNPTTEASDAGWRLDLVSKENVSVVCAMLCGILPFGGNMSTITIQKQR
jgi:hypothetical protein